MSDHHISKQLKRFLVTGITATLIDLAGYSSFLYLEAGTFIGELININLLLTDNFNVIFAKSFGFLCAVSFAYVGHRSWTFKSHGSSSRLTGFALLYISALVINNLVNLAMLDIFGRENEGFAIAFVIASGVTASINFIVMKFLIFRPAQPVAVED